MPHISMVTLGVDADAGSLQDLDGHLWEVAHNPFSPLRDDGGLSLPAAHATGA